MGALSIDPAVHYLRHGAYEGRQPSTFFDSTYYLIAYPDIAANGLNPLVHYLRFGAKEGRQIHQLGSASVNRSPSRITKSGSGENKVGKLSQLKNIGARVAARWAEVSSSQLEQRVNHLLRFVSSNGSEHAPELSPVDFDRLKISWVIPDFEPGAGGHMTIFRIARYLEEFGHEVQFLIQNPTQHTSGAAAKDTINRHFQPFTGRVELFDHIPPDVGGDALIATDRFTCYPVNAMRGFHRKFYFVQDYETLFYPAGTESLLTDATYNFDFDCLCAGDWLHRLMSEKFGRWSISWPLAYDPSLYHEDGAIVRSHNRIAFYARYVTARRAVELGVMALDILRERGLSFEVDFFGWDLGGLSDRGYGFIDHGSLPTDKLASLYQRSTVGVVFSATNHSLVNKEMMACGLPVVDLNVESTRAIFPSDTISLAEPTPAGIADAIQEILEDTEQQERMRQAGLNYVHEYSWRNSAEIVEAALKERVKHHLEVAKSA